MQDKTKLYLLGCITILFAIGYGLKVANIVSSGVVDPNDVSKLIMSGAILIGLISWTMISYGVSKGMGDF